MKRKSPTEPGPEGSCRNPCPGQSLEEFESVPWHTISDGDGLKAVRPEMDHHLFSISGAALVASGFR